MQTQNIIKELKGAGNSKGIICVANYVLDNIFGYGIFNLAKTTRPVSRHGGFLYYGN